MEIQKSFHSVTSVEYTGSIAYQNYAICDAAADLGVGGVSTGGVYAPGNGLTSYTNGFALALECESFAGKSNVLLSGLNTLNSNIFFEANLGFAATTALIGNGAANTMGAITGPTASFTLDFFANFDIIYVIQDGQMTARF
jgi:hypothetical protein